MPRRLFQVVLERVRRGISSLGSRPAKVFLATSSARLVILPRVTLSRALRRALMGLVAVFFAMRHSVAFEVLLVSRQSLSVLSATRRLVHQVARNGVMSSSRSGAG